MKLRIRIIEKRLDDEQVAARDDCESLQEYLNEVIEDVRRLSRDLSPAILEDIGLTSALRWPGIPAPETYPLLSGAVITVSPLS